MFLGNNKYTFLSQILFCFGDEQPQRLFHLTWLLPSKFVVSFKQNQELVILLLVSSWIPCSYTSLVVEIPLWLLSFGLPSSREKTVRGSWVEEKKKSMKRTPVMGQWAYRHAWIWLDSSRGRFTFKITRVWWILKRVKLKISLYCFSHHIT